MAPRNPVFVVGGARSGTTFLAKLFDSHPDVLYRHEPDSVLVNLNIPFLPRHDELNALLPEASSYLDSLCNVRATKASGRRPFFDKSYRSALQQKCFLSGLYLAQAAERAGRFLGYRHVEAPDCINPQARDHITYLIKSVDTPWRTMLYSLARPNWRFVHIVRHPCAVINSRLRGIESNLMTADTYLRSPFEAGMAEEYPFTLEDLEARSYEERIAFHWMICNQRVNDDMSGREGYRLVVYEDLCQDLAATTRQLFDFAGLSFDEQTQEFLEQLETMEPRDTRYFDILRPPQASLYKWREQLSDQQVENIKQIVSHSAIGRHFFEND